VRTAVGWKDPRLKEVPRIVARDKALLELGHASALLEEARASGEALVIMSRALCHVKRAASYLTRDREV